MRTDVKEVCPVKQSEEFSQRIARGYAMIENGKALFHMQAAGAETRIVKDWGVVDHIHFRGLTLRFSGFFRVSKQPKDKVSELEKLNGYYPKIRSHWDDESESFVHSVEMQKTSGIINGIKPGETFAKKICTSLAHAGYVRTFSNYTVGQGFDDTLCKFTEFEGQEQYVYKENIYSNSLPFSGENAIQSLATNVPFLGHTTTLKALKETNDTFLAQDRAPSKHNEVLTRPCIDAFTFTVLRTTDEEREITTFRYRQALEKLLVDDFITGKTPLMVWISSRTKTHILTLADHYHLLKKIQNEPGLAPLITKFRGIGVSIEDDTKFEDDEIIEILKYLQTPDVVHYDKCQPEDVWGHIQEEKYLFVILLLDKNKPVHFSDSCYEVLYNKPQEQLKAGWKGILFLLDFLDKHSTHGPEFKRRLQDKDFAKKFHFFMQNLFRASLSAGGDPHSNIMDIFTRFGISITDPQQVIDDKHGIVTKQNTFHISTLLNDTSTSMNWPSIVGILSYFRASYKVTGRDDAKKRALQAKISLGLVPNINKAIHMNAWLRALELIKALPKCVKDNDALLDSLIQELSTVYEGKCDLDFNWAQLVEKIKHLCDVFLPQIQKNLAANELRELLGSICIVPLAISGNLAAWGEVKKLRPSLGATTPCSDVRCKHLPFDALRRVHVVEAFRNDNSEMAVTLLDNFSAAKQDELVAQSYDLILANGGPFLRSMLAKPFSEFRPESYHPGRGSVLDVCVERNRFGKAQFPKGAFEVASYILEQCGYQANTYKDFEEIREAVLANSLVKVPSVESKGIHEQTLGTALLFLEARALNPKYIRLLLENWSASVTFRAKDRKSVFQILVSGIEKDRNAAFECIFNLLDSMVLLPKDLNFLQYLEDFLAEHGEGFYSFVALQYQKQQAPDFDAMDFDEFLASSHTKSDIVSFFLRYIQARDICILLNTQSFGSFLKAVPSCIDSPLFTQLLAKIAESIEWGELLTILQDLLLFYQFIPANEIEPFKSLIEQWQRDLFYKASTCLHIIDTVLVKLSNSQLLGVEVNKPMAMKHIATILLLLADRHHLEGQLQNIKRFNPATHYFQLTQQYNSNKRYTYHYLKCFAADTPMGIDHFASAVLVKNILVASSGLPISNEDARMILLCLKVGAEDSFLSFNDVEDIKLLILSRLHSPLLMQYLPYVSLLNAAMREYERLHDPIEDAFTRALIPTAPFELPVEYRVCSFFQDIIPALTIDKDFQETFDRETFESLLRKNERFSHFVAAIPFALEDMTDAEASVRVAFYSYIVEKNPRKHVGETLDEELERPKKFARVAEVGGAGSETDALGLMILQRNIWDICRFLHFNSFEDFLRTMPDSIHKPYFTGLIREAEKSDGWHKELLFILTGLLRVYNIIPALEWSQFLSIADKANSEPFFSPINCLQIIDTVIVHLNNSTLLGNDPIEPTAIKHIASILLIFANKSYLAAQLPNIRCFNPDFQYFILSVHYNHLRIYAYRYLQCFSQENSMERDILGAASVLREILRTRLHSLDEQDARMILLCLEAGAKEVFLKTVSVFEARLLLSSRLKSPILWQHLPYIDLLNSILQEIESKDHPGWDVVEGSSLLAITSEEEFFEFFKNIVGAFPVGEASLQTFDYETFEKLLNRSEKLSQFIKSMIFEEDEITQVEKQGRVAFYNCFFKKNPDFFNNDRKRSRSSLDEEIRPTKFAGVMGVYGIHKAATVETDVLTRPQPQYDSLDIDCFIR